MTQKPIKTEAIKSIVPQTRDEAVSAVAKIGEAQRERERLKLALDTEITALREQYEKLMSPYVDKIKGLSQGVHVWAEANRMELTQNGKKKTADLMTGELRWRTTPPACKAVRTKEAIEEIRANGLAERFLRTVEELNKEAILADPKKIVGFKWLSVVQKENFVIVPFETELEEIA